MLYLRFYACLLVAAVIGGPAFAKTETLAERGKRMCEEAGVALEDCHILPPGLRGPGPDSTIAAATPEPRPIKELGPGPAGYGTGKYGWCEDCTSLLAAAPVTPWSTYGGRQFQPIRDEDDRDFASNDSSSPGGSPGEGDDGDSGDGTDDGSDNGDDGDNGDGGDGGDGGDQGDNGDDGGNRGGEICD